MKYLKYIFLTLCFLFWPVSFVLKNPNDFLLYLVSGLLVLLSLFLFSKSSPKLRILSTLIFVLALIPSFLAISKNSIFVYDPLAYDTQVKKVGQISNRTLARVVQNKYTIYLDKFSSNLFLNFDINNFFFSLHPRETGNNQNLNKFPYSALPFLILGIVAFISPKKRYPFYLFLVCVFFLSLIKNPDRYDFILWPIIFLFISKGANSINREHPRLVKFYYIISIPLVIFDFVRTLLLKGS